MQSFPHKRAKFPHNDGMGLIVIRTALIFLTLMFIMRLMGKRQIGEMQPFELVITLIIADLACIPMADTTIPLLYGVIAIVTIFFFHQLICLVDLKFAPLKKILSGEPSLVLTKHGIDIEKLKQNNMDASDLMESVRSAGFLSLEAVSYGIYESNGQFSALADESFEGTSLSLLIINDGTFCLDNVKETGLTEADFRKILKKRKIHLKNVYVLTVDGDGKAYLQERGKGFTTFQIPLSEEQRW